MSNKLFQSVIHQMEDVIDRIIGVIDENGMIIACSKLTKIGESRQGICDEIAYTSECIVQDGYTYRALSNTVKSDYVVFVEGADKSAEQLAMVLVVALNNIKNLYNEKYDKSAFVKKILQENLMPGDIFVKSKELHFETDVNRAVFLIHFVGRNDMLPYDMILNMFPDKHKDFVISDANQNIVLVKELRAGVTQKEIERIARQISDTLNTEFYAKVVIGIGSVSENISTLHKSYQDAQTALEVGRVFDSEKNIVNYESLGIGRLIHKLPSTLCELFLQEVFKKGSLETLDRETLTTIQAFFENNLNVSETSRKLFVHRNTLVYRLEKIRKLTGLDLREFEHAITFKVALMVKKYLSTLPPKPTV